MIPASVEPSHRDPVDFYADHALAFDAARSRSLEERAWLDAFLAPVPAGGHVLDLGCGSGEPMAAYMLARGMRVTGVDPSAALLALARSRFPQARWVAGDMRTLELGMRFDAILAWDSLFHLTRDAQRAAIARIADHAAPGSTFMFTSGGEEGEAINPMFGEPLYHASLEPDEYRALLAARGFHVLRHVAGDAHCGGRTIWLAQRAPNGELDD